MLKQLNSASEQLRASIDNYIGVFSIINDCLKHIQTLPSLPPELASYLENEFALISSYEQKLQKARIGIGCARNHLTSATPISKLPAEILTRIFHLVSADYCHLPSPDGPTYFPRYTRYPDFLVHICSRWRKIALSTPSLWAHIDLTPHFILGRGASERAQAYSKRAGGILCEIHLDDKGCASEFRHRVDRVVSNLASHSKALEFVIRSPQLRGFHCSVFQSLIAGCEPKNFKRLCVRSEASLPDRFIKGRNTSH
ncbi:hypothetical protein FRC11_011811 [Ceratobasidium sp. 423]|nr:hypothetical protein FRC11_011811 [Ceratobasidium sp. 423]